MKRFPSDIKNRNSVNYLLKCKKKEECFIIIAVLLVKKGLEKVLAFAFFVILKHRWIIMNALGEKGVINNA